MNFIFTIFIILLFLLSNCVCNIDESLRITNEILTKIWNDWEIDKYPTFLISGYMPRHSYELIKHRFKKIISHAIFNGKTKENDNILTSSKLKFVISFMGSSVTAGHDSPSNMSFPVVTEKLMKLPFKTAGIDLEIRNTAMGNNPCLPYDACSQTFSGHDADIIHWEQSYNCFPTDEGPKTRSIFETFVRQIALMENRPIIVFSDSNTPNWHASDCPANRSKTIFPSKDEINALKSIKSDGSGLHLFTDSNSKIMNMWGAIKHLVGHYPSTGMQFFTHSGYEKYKCKGPYIDEWGCCSASWHPSRTGHALRAAHHAYTWLTIWKTALSEMATKMKSSNNKITKQDMERHLKPIQDVIPKRNLYDNMLGDGKIQCFTDFEPHYDMSSNLTNIVIHSSNWKKSIMETIFEPNSRIVEIARKKGYADFKWLLYGSKEEGPLYLDINVHKQGHIMLCQPPGSWGKIPDKFASLWNNQTIDIHITPNIDKINKENFQFTSEIKTKSIQYYIINPRPKDGQSVCGYTDKEVPIGSHVLTLSPLTSSFMMLSVILIP